MKWIKRDTWVLWLDNEGFMHECKWISARCGCNYISLRFFGLTYVCSDLKCIVGTRLREILAEETE